MSQTPAPPNAPEVDVPFPEQFVLTIKNFNGAFVPAAEKSERGQFCYIDDAVKYFGAREAAEVAGLREDIADRNRTIECKNIDIRERDASLHGWAERAKKAEDERDALAAEVGALRLDAERWREVERRFNESKTSAACLVLEGLGLEPTPYRDFAETVDAARAEAGHG